MDCPLADRDPIGHGHGCVVHARDGDFDLGLVGGAVFVGDRVAEVDVFALAFGQVIKLADGVVDNAARRRGE